MAYLFRHSICNEIYQGWVFADACRSMRQTGYKGIEIAPFTLSEKPASIPADERREYRRVMEGEGLHFVGFHWLLLTPKGLHVTTPDDRLRKRSWNHIRELVDLCGDLAGDREECGVLVFGSPSQRGTTGGASRAEATRYFVEGMAGLAPHAEQRKVTVLFEALPRNQCDVMGSLDEAAAAVTQIGSPAIQTMFDTHNAVDEAEPHATLVDRYFNHIRHVHLNETDGRHPGTGDYNFRPVLEVLARRDYQGWVSLECFDFSPGAEAIATESLEYLNSQIAGLEK